MKEGLIIKNFGPIKKVEIDDIKQFVFFVGASGSGKSTIIKIIAFMRWIYKMINIRSYLHYSNVKDSPFKFNFKAHLKTMGLFDYLHKDTYFEYSNGSYKITYQNQKLHTTKRYVPKEELSLEQISFLSERRTIVSEIFDGTLNIKKSAYYANETFKDYKLATDAISEFDLPGIDVKFAVKKLSNGVKHEIKQRSKDSDYSISLNQASSGIQSTLPLAIIAEYYTTKFNIVEALNKSVVNYLSTSDSLKDFKASENIGSLPNKRVSLLVEEPEISLFPSAQCDMINFLVGKINSVKDYVGSLIVATHSPYIISHLNVLLRRKYPEANINPNSIQVFMVNDGELINLVGEDGETQEIVVDSRYLSEPMASIFEEYNKLGYEE